MRHHPAKNRKAPQRLVLSRREGIPLFTPKKKSQWKHWVKAAPKERSWLGQSSLTKMYGRIRRPGRVVC
jgi:hypothetical protein